MRDSKPDRLLGAANLPCCAHQDLGDASLLFGGGVAERGQRRPQRPTRVGELGAPAARSIVGRVGAGAFSRKRSPHVLHLRPHPFELGEDRIDNAAILLEVGTSFIADAIELFRTIDFYRGVTQLLEIAPRAINHPGTWSIAPARSPLQRLDAL